MEKVAPKIEFEGRARYTPEEMCRSTVGGGNAGEVRAKGRHLDSESKYSTTTKKPKTPVLLPVS